MSGVQKLFHALSKTFDSLFRYYTELLGKLSSGTSINATRGFPYISEYNDGTVHHFTYEERLGRRGVEQCIFKVKIGKKFGVVKFTEEYNEKAHRLLAAKGCAPALHYVGPTGEHGGLRMVVMDFVDGGTLPNNVALSEPQYAQIKKAVDILHREGLVYGDLRPPNIMISEKGPVLIDFDWCKEADKGRYPSNLSLTVNWANGVGRSEVMKVEHDNEMLERLRPAR